MNKELPKETKIYYSNIFNIFSIIMGINGFYCAYLFLHKSIFLAILFVLVGCISIYIYGKRVIQNKPQIIINEQGIKIISKERINWGKISHVEIRTKGYGKHTKYYLDIHEKNKNRKGLILATINITELGISNTKLDQTIKKYHSNRKAILKHYDN